MSSSSSKIIPPTSDLESDVLIKVDNVSKKFCRDFKKSLWYGLKDTAADIFHPNKGCSANQEEEAFSLPPLRPSEFWANQSISFEVKRGECLGLIGHNGAGKTTLLKMLNGLMKPDTGSIEMRGRIGALIALGAGFNPILTGRENVYVNGSILGLHKREIDDKLDEIIDFAELEDAIDAPVRTYSSGMQVRLGFAVATSIEPQILIIDEVLAVGDVGFRAKCYNRIHEMRKKAAVIFVSHTMPHISRLCSQTIVMKNGVKIFDGNSTKAIDEYNKLFSGVKGEVEVAKDVIVDDIKINEFPINSIVQIRGGEDFQISFLGTFPNKVRKLEVAIYFQLDSEDIISQASNKTQGLCVTKSSVSAKYTLKIKKLFLGSGQKTATLRVLDDETGEILFWGSSFIKLNVQNESYITSPLYHIAEYNVDAV